MKNKNNNKNNKLQKKSQIFMRPIKLIVKTNSDKYPIIIGRNLISNLSQIFKKNSINFKKCLLVLDKNIPNKYTRGMLIDRLHGGSG